MKDYIAVIQAGGKGTRMTSLTRDLIPKPMLKLNGKPLLQWQIENVAAFGIKRFVIIIGHLGEKIREYFGNGESFGVEIEYIEEKQPLGSAGALYYLKETHTNDDFWLIFGDVMFDLAWDRMVSFHEEKKALGTLLVHPNSHPYDSDLVILSESSQVMAITEKGRKHDNWYENLVNSGIYILNHQILDLLTEPAKTDLEQDILVPLIKTGKLYGYRTSEYVKDTGTPERFRKASREQIEGIWERRSLRNRQSCVFLDRDGTLNQYRGLISNESEFELELHAAEAVKMLNEAGILAIVVTNQPVVARGMCEIEDVKRIHRKLQTLLGDDGAYLDDIVFCPHHPDKGYPEENPQYKIVCNCRKPATGMIDDMVKKYHIDINSSYIVGDSTVDIQTGICAGLKTILLETGQGGKDGKFDVCPDVRKKDIRSAVEFILQSLKREGQYGRL